jgi:hypothetical protein
MTVVRNIREDSQSSLNIHNLNRIDILIGHVHAIYALKKSIHRVFHSYSGIKI